MNSIGIWFTRLLQFKALARALVVLTTASGACAALPIALNDPAEGQQLARELRGTRPAENAEFSGVLRIFSPGKTTRDVTLRSEILVTESNWITRYEAESPDGTKERLSIRRSLEKSNEYEWERDGQVIKLSGAQATNRFIRSDFALFDLGLEFFHWPTQMVVTREMRKGRGCDVLESRPAYAGPYSRVLAWVDQESRKQGQPGLLMAEAYDRHGRILKEFEVTGFKKVDGTYQVSEMEIRNRQAKTRTRLQFDFDKE